VGGGGLYNGVFGVEESRTIDRLIGYHVLGCADSSGSCALLYGYLGVFIYDMCYKKAPCIDVPSLLSSHQPVWSFCDNVRDPNHNEVAGVDLGTS
jgi:hypothetical protein